MEQKPQEYKCSECGIEVDKVGKEINNPSDPFRHNPQETIKIPVKDQNTHTPTQSLKQYDFYRAIEFVRSGRKIKRFGWPVEEYGILKDGFVMIHKPDGKFYNWNISDGDLMGIDWIIIN